MMYTDVDEFVFYYSWLNEQVGPEAKGIQEVKTKWKDLTSRALLNMVMSLSSQRKQPSRISESYIGQLSFKCRNFGPSGLTEHLEKEGIKYLYRVQGVAAVRSQAPAQEFQWSAKSVALVDNIHNPVVTETMKVNAEFMNDSQTIEWNHMVYESYITDKDVLFAKGINHKQGLNVAARDLHCIFNGTIETPVTVFAQEVFRCEHLEDVPHQLLESKITL
ncbi:hypothetical protein SUGI_0754400 [Cryptomeria japonica]|nr:hypothetical protein SUGI_0754400 [Cryptomeria japonica]